MAFQNCKSFQHGDGGADASFGTQIVQYCRRQEDPNAQSSLKNVNCERPAFLSSIPFLQSLQGQMDSCRAESDSENDMRALQSCIERKLQHDAGDVPSGKCEETKSDASLQEMDMAFLTISMHSDASFGDGPQEDERCNQRSESNGYQRDEKQHIWCEQNYYEGSVFGIGPFDGESETEGAGDVTSKNYFKPDFCRTPELLKCPKKRKAFTYTVEEKPDRPTKLIFTVPDCAPKCTDIEICTSRHYNQSQSSKTSNQNIFDISSNTKINNLHHQSNRSSPDPYSSEKHSLQAGIKLITSTSPVKSDSLNHFPYSGITPSSLPESNEDGGFKDHRNHLESSTSSSQLRKKNGVPLCDFKDGCVSGDCDGTHQNNPRFSLHSAKSNTLRMVNKNGEFSRKHKNGDSAGERETETNRCQPHHSPQSTTIKKKCDNHHNENTDFPSAFGSKFHQPQFLTLTTQSQGEQGKQPHQLLSGSCPTIITVAEDYLYEDKEKGIKFVERRWPSLALLYR